MQGSGMTLVGSMPRPANEPSSKTWRGRVALRLRALRKATKLTAQKAATAITNAGYEVGRSSIYRWEDGTNMPQLEGLPAIAKVYGVPIRELFPVK